MGERPSVFYPIFATGDNRLKTYASWPGQLQNSARSLSVAGFFYTGSSDVVQCFSCGHKVRNWSPDADPWEEHDKTEEDCGYLSLCYARVNKRRRR